MADIRYVELDYVVPDYVIVDTDTGYLLSDYVVDGYVGKPATSAEAVLSTAFVTTATPSRTRPSTSTSQTAATITAQIVRIKPAQSAVTASVSVSVSGSRTASASSSILASTSLQNTISAVRGAASSIQGSASVTPDSSYTARPQITLTSQTTVTAQGGVTKPANTSLLAFNTQVSVTARIRSTQSDMTVSTTMTSVANRIRYTATQNNLETINPTPYTGITLDRQSHFVRLDDEEYTVSGGVIGNYTIDGSDDQDQWIYDAHFVFWLRFDDYQGGTVLSSPGTAFNLENAFRLSMTPSQVNISYGYSAGTTGGWSTQFNIGSAGIQPGEWHHYIIQVDHDIQGNPSPWNARIFVDSVETDVKSGYYNAMELFIKAINPITIGAQHNINGTYTNGFSGAIEQLWIANNVSDARYEFFNYEDPFSGFIDFGDTGRLTRPPYQLTQPAWYEKFDYPYTDDVRIVPYSNTNSNLAITTDFIPEFTLPILGRFRLNTIGDNIKYGVINLDTAATFSAVGRYAYFGDVTVSSEFTLSAVNYEFDKASAALASSATVSIQPGNALRSAQAAFTSAWSAVLRAQPNRSGDIDLHSEFTFTADATTAQLGRMSAEAEFNLAAQTYEFTKASVSVSASAALTAEGRLQDRERGNLLSGMEFTLTASISTTKLANTTVNSQFTFSPDGDRTARTSVSMSALAFEITAGRVLGLQIEYTYRVAQETGQLLVQDLEKTILSVGDSSELNSILVADGLEAVDLTVAEETSTLLVQT